MNKEEKIRRIEKFLRFNYDAGIEGALNHPAKEIVSDYKQRVSNIPYSFYINSADLHYFICRQLYYKYIGEYAYFCAHQCVENYLKAMIKFIGLIPPNIHHLADLVEITRKNTNVDTCPFIHSEELQMISSLYEPYYEFARYPVQNIRPKDGKYAMFYPDGIKVLDLFVYRMRETIAIPKRSQDSFSEVHPNLRLCAYSFPSFYNQFKSDNINFE